ncbi:MAG: SemiSWEET family transporter, partial [Candidatus ainarchaeum sp.]|nr:SemiSWEET family transporter [Candidatus ainarchaeum sp.]
MAIDLLPVLATILGVGGALSILFQTVKMVRLHESRDVALPTYFVLFLNSAVWLAYGTRIGDLPLVIANVVATVTTLSVIVAFFIYRAKNNEA